MEGQSLHQITFFIVIVLVSVLSASLLYNSPVAKTANNKFTINYFSAFFVTTACAHISNLVLPYVSQVLTILVTNSFILVSVYCLRFGLMWRLNMRQQLWQSGYVISHVVIFVASQVALSVMLPESFWFRLANISANSIFVLLGCVALLNKSPTKPSYGEGIARFSFIYIVIGLVLIPIFYHTFGYVGYYYAVITVLFVVALFALMGGLQSLLMSDVIDVHYQTSIQDPLTGIYNRRYFFQAVSTLAESRAEDRVNSVILCDIDKFKQFNDQFGHDVGDKILVKFATMLRDNVGEVGIVSRYGGEEFTILLKNHSLPQAVEFAEHLRFCAENLTIADDKTSLAISASFGVSEVWELSDIDLALKLADDALLRAKATGRNRVVSN